MNTQRENVRPVDVTKGENAHPTGIKPFGSTSLNKLNLNTQLKPSIDFLHSNRKILSDKSNKGGFFKSSIKQQQHITDTTATSTTKVYVNEKTNTTTVIKNEDTQVNALSNEELKIKEEFFEDNKTRYKEEESIEETVQVVPVLPIVVPKNLRHLYEKHNTSYKVGSKRPYQTNSLMSDVIEKKQKSGQHDRLFAPNAPPIKFQVNEETRNYEKQLETRAKLSMLQTTQVLKEHQWNDPLMVAEYAGEIFGYLYDTELKVMGDPRYALNLQHEVTWRMRGVLIDWVIEMHYTFSLLPETLFLAVNIVDRFLSLRTVVLGKLQLVGVTALFIATKFEELKSPSVQEFLFMTDFAVREDELIKAERFILQVLDFHLCYPNPVNFLRRVCTDELRCDVHTRTLAKYFMEIACVDHTFISIRPSKVAAASLWLSRKMLAKGRWNNTFTKIAGYSPEELRPTVEAMLDYLSQPVYHDAFFKKWSSTKLSKASIFVRDWINRYYIN